MCLAISTGNGARLLAAALLVHGDDRRLIIPPKIAPIHVVIIPILFEEGENEVMQKVKTISSLITRLGLNVVKDDSTKTLRQKFYNWELKGAPIRVEIGPKEVHLNYISIVRRDTNERSHVSDDDITVEIPKTLEQIQQNLWQRAYEMMVETIQYTEKLDEIGKLICDLKIAKTPWCSKQTCYDTILTLEQGIDPIGQDIAKHPFQKTCVVCDEPANEMLYVARSY